MSTDKAPLIQRLRESARGFPTDPYDRHLLCEAADALDASHWRPIGTAPRGEDVWVWDPTRGANPAMVCEQGIWVITYDDEVIHPTHWMPCPGPPTPEDQ